MAAIWNTICEVLANLVKPTRRKTRITFSPSTLHRELQRRTKLAATTNPFFNFLAELRLKAQDNEHANNSLSQRDMRRIPKIAGYLWRSMCDEEKQPYRKLAVEQKKLKRLKRKRRSPWTRNKGRRPKIRTSLSHRKQYQN